jgi:thioredoxin:protein disulfide reductase
LQPRIVRLVVAALLALVFSGPLAAPSVAQSSRAAASPLPVDRAFQLSVTRETDGRVRLAWAIARGHYLYEDKFALRAGGADIALPVLQGNGQSKDDPTFGVTTVFHDRVSAVVPRVGGATMLEVTYQGCDEGRICYPPVTRQIDLATLAITDPDERSAGSLATAWTAPAAAVPQSDLTVAADAGGMVASLLRDGGMPMLLGSFLLFGVALAFTPCVLPMYPILAGAIARQGEAVTARRGFSLSLSYVLAMASAFGLLGVAAAWSGQNLQMALQSTPAIGVVSALFVVLALSMFGLFELQMPSAWLNVIGRVGAGTRGSHGSAAALGFTSALIVGPCVTAPLAGALVYIAQTGDVTLGAAALFALGIGKGIPLVAFGTLGPKALPKAGAWMIAVRQAFGVVFLGAAIWMVSRIMVPEAVLALWALFALGLATWLGAFDALAADVPARRRVAKAAGLAAALYGVLLAIGAASGGGDPLRPLGGLLAQRGSGPAALQALAFRDAVDPSELGQRLAQSNGRPSLVYVTADWCVTCQVIHRSVLSDPGVQARLSGFNLIKLDVTANTPAQREMMRSLQVVGPPTMIFVDPRSREAAGTRLVGDVTTASLKQSADRAETVR